MATWPPQLIRWGQVDRERGCGSQTLETAEATHPEKIGVCVCAHACACIWLSTVVIHCLLQTILRTFEPSEKVGHICTTEVVLSGV